ncbi:MAG: hypothetical protein FWF08_00215 [Oscillospiraceae bacterium]|nr:hypothetical protein [Oscillospiraceae bacterium]
MKQAIKSGLLQGVLFGLITSILHFIFDKSIKRGVIYGISMGIFFTVFWFVLLYSQSKKFKKIKQVMSEHVDIIYDGAATRFIKTGLSGDRGWLFLTNTELIFIFIPQKHKLQDRRHNINLSDISDISKRTKIGAINSIAIKQDGKIPVNFALDNRKIWLQKIEQAKENILCE